MQLVEQHRISRTDPRFAALEVAAFASKNLYNAALYHTSKCSFFDGEPIGKREVYTGRRVRRGLFRTAGGLLVHADVNAAYNQIVNVAPDAFGSGRRGAVVAPGRIALPNRALAR
jgi:hypothetical protein